MQNMARAAWPWRVAVTLLPLALLHVSFELQTSVALLIATILFLSVCSVLFMVLAHSFLLCTCLSARPPRVPDSTEAAQNPQSLQ